MNAKEMMDFVTNSDMSRQEMINYIREKYPTILLEEMGYLPLPENIIPCDEKE